MYNDVIVKVNNKALNSQQTSHSSPSRVSYGMPIVRMLRKINWILGTKLYHEH